MIRAEDNAEEQLLAFVGQLNNARMGWQAVHLHLSALSRFTRKDYNLRIARNALIDVTQQFDGRIFLLENDDIVMLVKGALVSQVNEAVFKVKYLFQDDPLAKQEDALSTWYDLSIRYDALHAMAEQLLRDKNKRKADMPGGGAADEIEPLDPGRLQKLIGVLRSLDVSAYMRRQPICALADDQPAERIFDELYVRIADLQRPLMPNVDFLGNRWLFQHVTETLDLRVLGVLAREPDSYLTNAISINLNVGTILSQQFIEFDAAIRSGTQKSVVIELQLFDVISDVGAYQFARDFARTKGFRIALDGLNALSFTMTDYLNLQADLFKVFWDDAMLNMARQNRTATLANVVEKHGQDRVILARCDDEAAVAFGKAAGVRFFQGRYIDYLVDPSTPSRN